MSFFGMSVSLVFLKIKTFSSAYSPFWGEKGKKSKTSKTGKDGKKGKMSETCLKKGFVA